MRTGHDRFLVSLIEASEHAVMITVFTDIRVPSRLVDLRFYGNRHLNGFTLEDFFKSQL